MADQQVLIVDDDLSMRQFLSILMEAEGYQVRSASTGEDALVAVENWWPALVLADLNMPGMNGLELMRALKRKSAERNRHLDVVMITAFGTTSTAIEAMKLGASDYVLKPFDNDELRLCVRRVLDRQALETENTQLRRALKAKTHFNNLVGTSGVMKEVYGLIHRVKDAPINCVIQGESGTGKEMVARAIHFNGSRRNGPFVAVNCGAIAENLVESELFGHKRGAFTGAVRDRVGLMESADGGTLFLDEVNSLPLSAQVKFLRALQERRITPVGGVSEIKVDVRVLAAANEDLEQAVEDGGFREDLFYRLNVIQLDLPPLRERGDDVLLLAGTFLKEFAGAYGKAVTGFEDDTARIMRSWRYPGNVRELRNLVERAVALTTGPLVQVQDLPDKMRGRGRPEAPEERGTGIPAEGVLLPVLLEEFEVRWLKKALAATGGNKTDAAKLLGMSFRSFRYRLAKFGLD